uniref:GDSL esterase/lipase n=1 Tax=Ananas comosus var. bracteatus TaxID=296719 RepID=A0A6V7QBW0_ANACO|nr:unnamed protein product [Ananas comosus var. bracteatus]
MREASKKSLLFIQLMLLLSLSAPPHYAAAKVTAIFVFGDSTVDAGNNNQIPTMLRSNFKPYGRDFAGQKPTGRFSNGRIATDFYSEAFGLRPFVPAYLDPEYGIKDFAVGVCFASAGSGLDVATSDVLVSHLDPLFGNQRSLGSIYIWKFCLSNLPGHNLGSDYKSPCESAQSIGD